MTCKGCDEPIQGAARKLTVTTRDTVTKLESTRSVEPVCEGCMAAWRRTYPHAEDSSASPADARARS